MTELEAPATAPPSDEPFVQATKLAKVVEYIVDKEERKIALIRGKNGDYFLKFTRPGLVTPLRLSSEGLQALQALIADDAMAG